MFPFVNNLTFLTHLCVEEMWKGEEGRDDEAENVDNQDPGLVRQEAQPVRGQRVADGLPN